MTLTFTVGTPLQKSILVNPCSYLQRPLTKFCMVTQEGEGGFRGVRHTPTQGSGPIATKFFETPRRPMHAVDNN